MRGNADVSIFFLLSQFQAELERPKVVFRLRDGNFLCSVKDTGARSPRGIN